MLGAQAREAEYAAAKKASARQASREAEEQKLPPKPVPISLSAYTRNAQVSRNKGTKAWVPLVLEKDEGDGVEVPREDGPSPVSSRGRSTTSNPNQTTPTLLRTARSNRIRVNLPRGQAGVPVAPRAMRPTVGGTPNVNQFSPMPRPPPAMMEATEMVPTALYPVHPGIQHVGMYPPFDGYPGLPVLEYIGPFPAGTPQGMRRYGGMMVPTDMTPTKQEQKMSMRSQAYPNPLYVNLGPPSNLGPPLQMYDPGMHVNESIPHYVNPPSMVQNPEVEYAYQQFHPEYPTILPRPEPPSLQSDYSPELNIATYDRPSTSFARPTSLPEPPTAPVTPPRSVAQLHLKNASASKKDKENEEPYDRDMKLRKFMEAQQATAKTGKTVLNNPELRKSSQESSTEATTEPEKTSSTPPKIRASPIDDDIFGGPTPRVAPKIPPGLENVQQSKFIFTYPIPDPPKYTTNSGLQSYFGAGTDDWFELKPPTRKDHKKMTNAMSYVALQVEQEKSKSSISTKAPSDVRKWMSIDSRAFQGARRRVDEIATDYSGKLHGDDESGEGVKLDRAHDINAGLVRGAGNVLANLTEYIDEGEMKTADTQQDYFNRTRPVPEYAIERSGVEANLSSLFEVGGYSYKPPNRMACDSRFRPHMEDGSKGQVKGKEEGDWASRQNLWRR